MDEKNGIEPEKMDEDAVNHNATNSWSNLTSSSMNLVAPCNLVTTYRGDFVGSRASCSSAPMVDSFGQELWDHTSDPPSENFRYCSASAHNNSNLSDSSGIRRIGPTSFMSEIGWNPLTPISKGSLYAPNVSNMLLGSFSVPQFPDDSGFIERAARFSCYSGGNLTSLASPFTIPESIGRYPVGPDPMIIFPSDRVKSGSRLNVEAPEDVDMASREVTSLGRHQDGAEQGTGLSSNYSDEGEYSGNRGGRANASMTDDVGGEGSSKEFILRKRKINNGKEVGSDKANEAQVIAKNGGDSQLKVEHGASTRGKGAERNDKQGTQTSDPPKGEYVHIRARRGQATNSHSLAERVRREKISERMKLLQDLVPGCSKVTGKAVMLDEIINYVQSLQRQVEFLSMKLATVNPVVDCHIEGFLAKEPRAGSSTLGLLPEMMMSYPQMNLEPPGLVPPDAMRRPIHGQTASLLPRAREPLQVPHNWEDELDNVVQMGFGGGDTAPSGQDIDGSPPADDMKAEL